MMGDMSERKNSTRRGKGWMDGGWMGRKARLKEGESEGRDWWEWPGYMKGGGVYIVLYNEQC
jgi:hypothetical protein